MRLLFNHKRSSLLVTLTCLTMLFVGAQLMLAFAHYKATDLVDALVSTSITLQLLHAVVLLPIFAFIALQLLAYVFFITWLWFVAVSIGDLFRFSTVTTYYLGLLIWCFACIALLALNSHYYTASFFAVHVVRFPYMQPIVDIAALVSSLILLIATVFAFIGLAKNRRHVKVGGVLIAGFLSVAVSALYDAYLPLAQQAVDARPNIIIIGLDSLRPDFTGYFGNTHTRTPNVDAFLSSAATFKQAYTPLARTFPSWISVLTAKHPKHSYARNNLVNPEHVIPSDTLARHMQQAGYETIYATDEKRFSNITEQYGFDRILGPKMGVNDFVLGSLADFPMSNLLVNLPIGKYLFPYNYGNRAAAITYEPETFLQLVKSGLAGRSGKPLFLSVHLCLAHWPFTWARDGQSAGMVMSQQYSRSVTAVDRQFGQLLQLLRDSKLLENSVVVLLSDHGTALGLRGDRVISEENYRGDKKGFKLIPIYKYSFAPQYSTNYKHDYSVNTAYGQGTNVLSLTQYHVLLAFKRYGGELPHHDIQQVASLLDIGPTLLDYLGMAPLNEVDGVSQRLSLQESGDVLSPRSLVMETGDSMTEIETDHIYVEKVLKHQIGIYEVDPVNGLLMMNGKAERSIEKNKQFAVLLGDWLLARYPARMDYHLKKMKANQVDGKKKLVSGSQIIPPYYVLANLKTGLWSVGLTSPLAKTAPMDELLRQLKAMYADEIG